MSERKTTTTSVSLVPEVSPSIASSDTRSLFVDSRGRIDMTDLLTSTREFSKQLPATIDYAAPVAQTNYDLLGYAPESHDDKDEYEEEPRSSEELKRELGRNALTRTLKRIDLGIAYGTAKLISKFPTTKSMEEREAHQKKLNEDYADKDGDSWLRRRLNSFGRNRMNIMDRLPVYGIGSLALARYGGPFAIDFAADAAHHVSDAVGDLTDGAKNIGDELHRAVMGPREVHMGEGQELAANAINMTPVVHDQKPKVYIMGGHTQGMAHESGYAQSLEAAGIINEGDDVQAINWSAQMGMPGENVNMVQSDIEGGAQIADAIRDAGGEPVKFASFSQGTQATLRGLNEAHAQGVDLSNVEVVLIGGPSGELGLGANKNISIAHPFLDAGGLEIDQPLPPGVKLTVRTDIADVFGNGGNQSLLTLGAMAMGPGHIPVGPENSVLISTYQKGNVTYEIWGPKDGINNPVTRMLKAQGLPITPEAEALANAAVPITMPGQATQYPDGPNVVSKAGAAADSYIPGSNGAFQAAANSALANPAFNKLTREFDDLVPVLDSVGRINPNDPIGAINTITNAGKEVNEAVQSFGQLLQNPAKALNIAVDAANSGINQAGGPALIPRFDETPAPAYSAPAPSYNQYVAPAPAAPVYEAPAPAPYVAPAPAPTPYVAPAPAPAPAYAPVAPLFSSAPAAPQYAPVGPIFGSKPAEPQYAPVGPLFG